MPPTSCYGSHRPSTPTSLSSESPPRPVTMSPAPSVDASSASATLPWSSSCRDGHRSAMRRRNVAVGDRLVEAGEHVGQGPQIVLSPAVEQFGQDIADPDPGGNHVAVTLGGG